MRNTPAYYVVKPREVTDIIDIVESLGDAQGFCRGNIMKYIYRAGSKTPGSKLEDLRKAQEYLNRYISIVEEEMGYGD